ncbi:MAG: flagellar basal body rod protein FlgF [Gammaproteobacteria bacterium]|nr:flagellar basal body rod protein FlgF [Gammaproteobacteria bacterium]
MDHSLYVAMSGAKQTMLAQAINANNLANLSTVGFRADLASMQSSSVEGVGLPTRVNSVVGSDGSDFSEGHLNYTERELDFAINGDGWIAVEGANGEEAYTRAGDMRVNSLGQLTTGGGLLVLGDGGPIALPPFEKLEIGKDGTISIRATGQAANTLQLVDRVKLVNPPVADLLKGKDGLFRLADGDTAVPDGSVALISGVLESSNVNAVDTLLNTITLAREFEFHIKVMETAQQNDEVTTQLLRIS